MEPQPAQITIQSTGPVKVILIPPSGSLGLHIPAGSLVVIVGTLADALASFAAEGQQPPPRQGQQPPPRRGQQPPPRQGRQPPPRQGRQPRPKRPAKGTPEHAAEIALLDAELDEYRARDPRRAGQNAPDGEPGL